jgi:dimethylsulfone monooxygenase
MSDGTGPSLLLRNPTMFGGHQFKLAIFGSNCSGGRAATVVPEHWQNTWEDNLKLAKLSDEVGIDAMVPVARWKGYGGVTNYEGSTFETITWACGLLAATKKLSVFGTVHVPLFPPVLAAKQMVTADHIGQGRFGLNIVCGWNQDEFDMFGTVQDEHDDRYARGQEWWNIVKRVWAGEGPFDFNGRYYHLRGVIGAPLPWGGRRPIMMNAGSSDAGRRFAARNSDLLFDQPYFLDAAGERIKAAKQTAREFDHEVQVFTSGAVVCRPTQKEADDYFHYFAVENADEGAIDGMFRIAFTPDRRDILTAEMAQTIRVRFAAGYGGLLAVGDPDRVALELKKLADAGFGGFAFSFVNYNDELPYFAQEVLPRLEQMGLREPVK